MDSRDIFISGKKVLLKALTRSDIESSGWFGWFNDDEVTQYMQQHYFPNTIEKQINFLSSLNDNSNKIQLGIYLIDGQKMIGCVSLSQIDWINRKAEFSIIIGDRDYRAKGVGKESTYLILKHAFQSLNLHKVYLGVHEKHEIALRSYESSGFVKEGYLREDMFKAGAYHGTIIMSILQSEFKELA
jgi:ribosomal-protein-alanine N-acetyltransferase